MDRAAFIRANTVIATPSHVPELSLHLADEALPLWQLTEDELAANTLPPPYWAFAWAGGQALARYLLDHPDVVRGKTVLDIGTGGGIVALAAAKAGARAVRANDVDAFALCAVGLNADVNGIAVELADGDLLGGDAQAEVVTAGDVFFERPLAERARVFLARAALAGSRVLVGDPGRSYLPRDLLTEVARYEIAVPRALEDADVKRTIVWTFAAA